MASKSLLYDSRRKLSNNWHTANHFSQLYGFLYDLTSVAARILLGPGIIAAGESANYNSKSSTLATVELLQQIRLWFKSIIHELGYCAKGADNCCDICKILPEKSSIC